MNDPGQLNKKRLSDHDYSRPGTYHLEFEPDEHSSTFGSERNGVMTLNAYGEIFFGVLGLALQIFSCLRLDGIDIRPRCVVLAVTILKWRKPFLSRFIKDFDRWHYRRTMTISAFSGYLKMNSGRSINKKRKRSGTHFWALGYKDRVMTDKREIASFCAELNANFARVRFPAASVAAKTRSETLISAIATAAGTTLNATFGALFSDVPVESQTLEAPMRPYDTMLLGSALFLNSSLLQPLPGDAVPESGGGNEIPCAHGGRTLEPLVFRIGPGRIFLSVPPER